MRFKKVFIRAIMTYILIYPHYNFFMNILPDLTNDRSNFGYFAAQISMLVLPPLTSLVFKDKAFRIMYLMVCYTTIALGDYVHSILYGIIFEVSRYSDINPLSCNTILTAITDITKIIFGNIVFTKTLDKSLSSE